MLKGVINIEISVIMPVYNEAIKYLKESISSILNQTYTDFEFIIVDDNPNSLPIRQYLLDIAAKDLRIKVFFNKINKGSMYSANKAILHSHGKYIARMDADDISKKTRLSRQLYFCKKYNIDFLSCNYFNMINGSIQKRSVYSDVTEIDQNKIRKVMSYINIATGSTLFFKRNIVNKIGGYRNILVEDYDLAARFLIHRYRVGYLSIPLIYKRYRKNSLSGENSLKEFIILRLISKCLRKYKYEQILPVSFINKSLSKIKSKDFCRYHKFILSSIKYKNNKSFMNALKRYYWACSSPLIFNRNIFMLFYKHIQNILLK